MTYWHFVHGTPDLTDTVKGKVVAQCEWDRLNLNLNE